jgi:Flp pilus assembly protein TadG
MRGPQSGGVPRDRRSAQALTEFALILPLLLLILLGVVDFGRVFYYWTSISNGAREGARYGIIHPAWLINGSTGTTGACKSDPRNIKFRVRQEAGTTVQLQDSDIDVYWVDTKGVKTAPTYTPNCSTLPADQRAYTYPNSVRVDVAYDFKAFTPMIGAFWGGGSLKIHSSAVMVIE